MYRKFCVFFLLTILVTAGNCYEEEEPGYLRKLTDFPFNIIDLPLAALNDGLYNALHFTSSLIEKVTNKVGSVTKKVLDTAHSIAGGTIESIRSVVQKMKDVKDGIGQTLSAVYNDLSGAGDEYINKLSDVRENVLMDALKHGHEFLKNTSQAAHNQMESALQAGQEALEKASELAKDFIKEAKEKGETKKVEILEKLHNELEKLKEQYKEVKAALTEKLKKLAESIKAHIGEEKYEEYKKKLEEFFHKMKSALHDGAELASKAKNKIEELLKSGKEALGNWSEELKPKIEHIKEKLHELQSKAATYKDNVFAAAKEKLAEIAEKSKNTMNLFFQSLEKVFKKSFDNLKNIFDATASLVGDFLNKGHSKEEHITPTESTPETNPSTESSEPTESNTELNLDPAQPDAEIQLPEGNEDEEPIIDDPLVYDIDVRLKSAIDFDDELLAIADTFDEATAVPTSEEVNNHVEPSNPDFGAGHVENAESAFNKLLEKIKEIGEKGKDTIEDLFSKGKDLYDTYKAKLIAAISDYIEFVKEKAQQMKEYLQNFLETIREKAKEAKKRFEDWLSKAAETIKTGVNNKFESISAQVKQKTTEVKEIYYKIKEKLGKLKEEAEVKLDEFRAHAKVKISNAIEHAHADAEKLKEFVEKKFLGGAKKSVECYNKHKEETSELLSKVTKEINQCGTDGVKEFTKAIGEALRLDVELSEKLNKLKEEFKDCKDKSGLLGSISCLGKLSYDQILGLSKASGEIIKAGQSAAQHITACAQDKIEQNGDAFSALRNEIEQCLAVKQE